MKKLIPFLFIAVFFAGCSTEIKTSKPIAIADSIDATYSNTLLKNFCGTLLEYKMVDEKARLMTKQKFGDVQDDAAKKYESGSYDSLLHKFVNYYGVPTEKILRDVQIRIDAGYPCDLSIIQNQRKNEIIRDLNN